MKPAQSGFVCVEAVLTVHLRMVQELSNSSSSLRARRMLAPDSEGIANAPKVDTASSSKATSLQQAKVPYLP